MSKLLENMIPEGAKKFEKKTEGVQMHPKRAPESFQDQRCDQRNPEMVSKRGPGTPEAPQRPTRTKKALLGVSKGPSWGGLRGSVESSFILKK